MTTPEEGPNPPRARTGTSSEMKDSMNMIMQSAVTRNGGYRGGRHEGAVTMPTERRGRARRWWQAAAATAEGCMRGSTIIWGSNRIYHYRGVTLMVVGSLCSIFVSVVPKSLGAKQTKAGKVYHQA